MSITFQRHISSVGVRCISYRVLEFHPRGRKFKCRQGEHLIRPFIYLSIYLFIYLSIHLSIRPLTRPFIYPSTHPSIPTRTHQSIYSLIHPFRLAIHPSIHQSINPSIDRSIQSLFRLDKVLPKTTINNKSLNDVKNIVFHRSKSKNNRSK